MILSRIDLRYARRVQADSARFRRVRSLVRRTWDRFGAERSVLANRHVAAKVLPLEPDKAYAVLTAPAPTTIADDGRPAPPPKLWKRWSLTLDAYIAGGRAEVDAMLGTLSEAGADTGELMRILDFGCAEGRILRFLDDSHRELWGVDVNAARIAWAQQHLTPPLRLATTTTAPHLPFSDGYFDLVYAVSVFTHISELADAWFLELLRIVRPGGHVYLTIHDEHSVEVLLERSRARGIHGEMVSLLDRFEAKTGTLGRGDWTYFAINADPGAQVFYRGDELVRRWSMVADFRLRKLEASAYQTALVFRRRIPTSPHK